MREEKKLPAGKAGIPEENSNEQIPNLSTLAIHYVAPSILWGFNFETSNTYRNSL
jgi:hypothetical protein